MGKTRLENLLLANLLSKFKQDRDVMEKIKYDWLSWNAYSSYQNLCEELDKVLVQIGSKYYITFA